MLFNSKNILGSFAAIVLLTACEADGNYPGVEYAPQMYHSVAYEPLTQIVKEDLAAQNHFFASYYQRSLNSLPYNKLDSGASINMLEPVSGTVARQNISSLTKSHTVTADQPLLVYDLIHKDSVEYSARMLKNPFEKTPAILEEGKRLYISYCAHCHGSSGKGDGKVADVYPGVANYTSGAVKNLNEGHIFHVITHGIRNMWAHKSQISVEDRWKITHYVQELQQGRQ